MILDFDWKTLLYFAASLIVLIGFIFTVLTDFSFLGIITIISLVSITLGAYSGRKLLVYFHMFFLAIVALMTMFTIGILLAIYALFLLSVLEKTTGQIYFQRKEKPKA